MSFKVFRQKYHMAPSFVLVWQLRVPKTFYWMVVKLEVKAFDERFSERISKPGKKKTIAAKKHSARLPAVSYLQKLPFLKNTPAKKQSDKIRFRCLSNKGSADSVPTEFVMLVWKPLVTLIVERIESPQVNFQSFNFCEKSSVRKFFAEVKPRKRSSLCSN